jgi:hypothetical protein
VFPTVTLSNNTATVCTYVRMYVCMYLAIDGSIRYLRSAAGRMNCMCFESFVVVVVVVVAVVQVSYGDRC